MNEFIKVLFEFKLNKEWEKSEFKEATHDGEDNVM
jgi:hypothetical protein